MFDFIIKYLVQFLMTSISGLLCYLISQYIGLRNGMRSLLKNEIVKVYETYINLGYCPSFIKENIQEIYENYHKLKGNGMATSMINEIYKLPNELRRKNEK